MNRKEFLKMCGLLGLTVPLQGVLSACSTSENEPLVVEDFSGKVLIVGAGAAGMTAGYLLAQNGVSFEILEASGSYGGRMKQTRSFADFPIPLGAEWLHVPAKELARIVNDSAVQISTQTVGYHHRDPVGHYQDGSFTSGFLADPGQDRKFINSTWFDFFETYITSKILPSMRFNTVVKSIDYSGSQVLVTDVSGRSYVADKVIFTAPLKMLQEGNVAFTPPLPPNKQKVIQHADVWGGIKIFIKFADKFYPTFLSFADSETRHGQRLYFDASYGQNSQQNVLGLFAVGQQAEQYQKLSGDAQIAYVLAELDGIFAGAASKTYQQHVVQNWSEELHIKSAYLSDQALPGTSNVLASPVDDKVYFAGEAYTRFDDWGSVHAAARAARDAVRSAVT